MSKIENSIVNGDDLRKINKTIILASTWPTVRFNSIFYALNSYKAILRFILIVAEMNTKKNVERTRTEFGNSPI